MKLFIAFSSSAKKLFGGGGGGGIVVVAWTVVVLLCDCTITMSLKHIVAGLDALSCMNTLYDSLADGDAVYDCEVAPLIGVEHELPVDH